MHVKEARDFRRQLPVRERVRADVAVVPGIEPRSRDAITSTERRDLEALEAVVLRDEMLDEREPFAF